MTLTANSSHLPPLGSHRREQVGQQRAAVGIGFIPDGRSATIASDTPVHAVERGALEGHVVMRERER